MKNFTISIFGNQIFLEIINEIKLFSKFNVKYFDELKYPTDTLEENKNLVIFFYKERSKIFHDLLMKKNLPIILILGNEKIINLKDKKFIEVINMPFSILDLEKKITSLFSKFEFNIGSLINLGDYVIDKNKREISRDNKILQLTEKEIDFFILFKTNKKPIAKNFILKQVWKYSAHTETHTVETHIHRLRKKILTKFGDKNFIKNNSEGYYI